MKFLPPTHVIENFLSKEEIDRICSDVFENKSYWKGAENYPTFTEKKSNFYNHKNILQNLLEQIVKFNINHTDFNSIKSCIDLIREYYKQNKLENNKQFFTNYIGDDEFMYFIVSEAIKILSNHGTITDKTLEQIYYNLFINDKFQSMFGDAIYLIEGKKDFIDCLFVHLKYKCKSLVNFHQLIAASNARATSSACSCCWHRTSC